MKAIYVSVCIIFMFVTGILQWDIFKLPWEYYRVLQALHIISSIAVSLLLIIPFVNMHTYKYRKNIIAGKRNSVNGIFLGLSLFLITLSGVYLFFIGNTGGDILGSYSFYIHLYGSFFLLFFLWYHSSNSSSNQKRKKLAKLNRIKKEHILASIALFMIFSPTLSYSKSRSALYLTKDMKYQYSANLDGGSVSKVDANSGEKIFEKSLGKDIRRIAFNQDESIYAVTDFLDNRAACKFHHHKLVNL